MVVLLQDSAMDAIVIMLVFRSMYVLWIMDRIEFDTGRQLNPFRAIFDLSKWSYDDFKNDF
jgi:hypothetical protein